jgi:hypothetical protein
MMNRKFLKIAEGIDSCSDHNDEFDLNAWLHPASAFNHPSEVVNDPDLTLNEKRAILAAWASDSCAVKSVPALRSHQASGKPVGFDEIMDALRALDNQAQLGLSGTPHYKRRLSLTMRRRSASQRRSSDDEHGPLH